MMEIEYIEIGGKRLQLPLDYQPVNEMNEDVVSRMSETLEQIERADEACVALGTSASFFTE